MACQIHATHSYPDEQKHEDADRQADQAAIDAQAERDEHAGGLVGLLVIIALVLLIVYLIRRF